MLVPIGQTSNKCPQKSMDIKKYHNKFEKANTVKSSGNFVCPNHWSPCLHRPAHYLVHHTERQQLQLTVHLAWHYIQCPSQQLLSHSLAYGNSAQIYLASFHSGLLKSSWQESSHLQFINHKVKNDCTYTWHKVCANFVREYKNG